MKTVGQILKSERLKKNVSLEHLSILTKIDTKYILALESDQYNLLPSETFIKGFIRNISLRLDRDPAELIAVFRRDFRHPQKQKTETFSHRKTPMSVYFFSNQLLPFVGGALIFLVYLGFQFRAILTPPKLEIESPTNQSVLVSPIEITGNTEVGAHITINGDTEASTDSSGYFNIRLSMPIGETEVEIVSTNRFNRSATKKLNLTIVSK